MDPCQSSDKTFAALQALALAIMHLDRSEDGLISIRCIFFPWGCFGVDSLDGVVYIGTTYIHEARISFFHAATASGYRQRSSLSFIGVWLDGLSLIQCYKFSCFTLIRYVWATLLVLLGMIREVDEIFWISNIKPHMFLPSSFRFQLLQPPRQAVAHLSYPCFCHDGSCPEFYVQHIVEEFYKPTYDRGQAPIIDIIMG